MPLYVIPLEKGNVVTEKFRSDKQQEVGLDTNCYLVVVGHKAFLIDTPPGMAESVISYCKEHDLTLEKIIITHSHWDHIADCSELLKAFLAEVFIHEEDAPNLIDPGSDKLPLRIAIDGVEPTEYLSENTPLDLGGYAFQVIHTPGHTPGGVCLYCKEKNIIFVGDTLFKSTIGRLDLPTSQSERMWPSLKKLAKLPADTVVYSGHGVPTTIGKETWLNRAEEIFS